MVLEQLAARGIQLVAVAVERDVAPGDHDAAFVSQHGVVHQRGRGNLAEVHGQHLRVAGGALDGLEDSGGARTEVVREIKLLSWADAAFGGAERLQVAQLRQNVDVDLEVCQVGNQAAASAGAELQLDGFV